VPYECFRAKDGFVNIAVTNQKQWINFCKVIGFPEAATDPRFELMKDRLAHYDELKRMMDPVIAGWTRAEVIQRMSEVGIPCGPINTVGEIMEDPQIQAREMVYELIHPEYGPLKVLGIPIKLSDTPGGIEIAPPRFGQHNREILQRIGYDDAAFMALQKSGVVAEAAPLKS
jgi:formyl-CoA transferase/CoA:oxalate CoA-transferase